MSEETGNALGTQKVCVLNLQDSVSLDLKLTQAKQTRKSSLSYVFAISFGFPLAFKALISK